MEMIAMDPRETLGLSAGMGKHAQVSAAAAFEAYMTQRRYQPNTLRNYLKAFMQFSQAIAPLQPRDLGQDEICRALGMLAAQATLSIAYQNHLIKAVKLYYDAIEGRPMGDCLLQRPKQALSLPKALSPADVAAILAATGNLKHKCILMLL